jgi:hypothetical protein
MPINTSLAFLDMFLLKGKNTIFFFGLALINLIK